MCIVWANVASAKIGLNISLLYKKGIGQGFFLSTEQHSLESLFENEVVHIKMNNGVSTKISAHFVQSIHDYGPSAFVRIKGELYGTNGKVIKSYNESPIDIFLGQTKEIIYKNGEEEQIEVLITPISI